MAEGRILSGEMTNQSVEPWQFAEETRVEARLHSWLSTCWWNPNASHEAELGDPQELIDVRECSRYEKNSG